MQGGNKLLCQTENGEINIGSCYANFSKFETDSGYLNLKSIHKFAEVDIHGKGSLNMSE